VQEKDGFNWFENLTLCPYDKNLIDRPLLSQFDIDFINAYHQRVWNTLSPYLQDDESALNWLKHATSPL
jgi:Xaa-Pro aminopeptidase